MEQKLHTPEGVRDIYNKECETKLALQKKLNTVLHLYGYKDIQTPTFEYYDVFREEIGSTSTQELYKFFDREGNILALRPDITPSVARAAATLFENEDFPIRLCYSGNTFINHSSYQGRLKESTQMGAELLGDDSAEADAEMLAQIGYTVTNPNVSAPSGKRVIWTKTGMELKPKFVTTGSTSGNLIEITEGLNDGEEIAVDLEAISAAPVTVETERSPFMPGPPGSDKKKEGEK